MSNAYPSGAPILFCAETLGGPHANSVFMYRQEAKVSGSRSSSTLSARTDGYAPCMTLGRVLSASSDPTFLGLDGVQWTAVGVLVAIFIGVVAFFQVRAGRSRTPAAPAPEAPEPVGLGAPTRIPLAQQFAPERYEDNPLNVVLESYLELEAWFNDLFDDRDIPYWQGATRLGPLEMVKIAVHRGLVHAQSTEAVRVLAFDRGLSIERRDNVTADEARTYANRVDELIAALGHQVDAYEANQVPVGRNVAGVLPAPEKKSNAPLLTATWSALKFSGGVAGQRDQYPAKTIRIFHRTRKLYDVHVRASTIPVEDAAFRETLRKSDDSWDISIPLVDVTRQTFGVQRPFLSVADYGQWIYREVTVTVTFHTGDPSEPYSIQFTTTQFD
jgi:hypothetical protein